MSAPPVKPKVAKPALLPKPAAGVGAYKEGNTSAPPVASKPKPGPKPGPPVRPKRDSGVPTAQEQPSGLPSRAPPPVPPEDTDDAKPPIVPRAARSQRNSAVEEPVAIFSPTAKDSPIAAYDENMELRENILREDGYEQAVEEENYNTIDEVEASADTYGSNVSIRHRQAPPVPADSPRSPNLPPVPDASNRRPMPPPSAFEFDKSDEPEEDDLYEEVSKPGRPQSTIQEKALDEDNENAIYEAIDEVKASVDAPPPVPTPYGGKRDSAAGGSPSPAEDKSPLNRKNKKSFFGGIKSRGSLPKAGKLDPISDQNQSILDSLTADTPKMFEVMPAAEPQPKITGDLSYGIRDMVEILKVDGCPVGRWVGRVNGEIGYVECSKLKVDANALKAMMDSQNMVKPVSAPSMVSPEGIPHNIGRDTGQPPTIIRKPRPDGEAPPPPVEAFSEGNSQAPPVAYETMDDVNQPSDTYEVIDEVKAFKKGNDDEADPNGGYEKMISPAVPPGNLGKGQAALLMGGPMPSTTIQEQPSVKPRKPPSGISKGQRALMTNSMIEGQGATEYVPEPEHHSVGEYENTKHDSSNNMQDYQNLPSHDTQEDDPGDYVNLPRRGDHVDADDEGVYANIERGVGGVPQQTAEPQQEDDMYEVMTHK